MLRTGPAWLPWPLPFGWLVTGFAGAGDERTGTCASAVALTGPDPLGGAAEMLVVAEEPGVGLGAGLAGLDGVDPGAGFAAAPPAATVSFGKYDFPLWPVDSPGRAAFAGEIKGHWMWVVLWPEPRVSCCSSRSGCVTCVIPVRTWTCPSERLRLACHYPTHASTDASQANTDAS
jgi:hypothetical protein